MYCVYCGVDHDEDVSFSNEHVIPVAMGGSDLFTIPVCESSNTGLGNRVDDPFISTFFVSSMRLFYDLKGASRRRGLPTADLSGKASINGREESITYRISNTQALLKLSDLHLSKEQGEETNLEKWRLSGHPSDVGRALRGKIESQTAEGKNVFTEDGQVLTLDNLDSFIAASIVIHEQLPVTFPVNVHWVDSARFFSKLALAIGHYLLGERFSRSSRATALRKAMRAANEQEARFAGLKVWPDAENFPAQLAKENSHVLGLMHTDPPILTVSLFGLLNGIVWLGEVPMDSNPGVVGASGRVLEVVYHREPSMTAH